MECDHQANSKGDLTQHQRIYMKERSTKAENVNIRQLQWAISPNTSKLYMKESSIQEGNVTNRQL